MTMNSSIYISGHQNVISTFDMTRITNEALHYVNFNIEEII